MSYFSKRSSHTYSELYSNDPIILIKYFNLGILDRLIVCLSTLSTFIIKPKLFTEIKYYGLGQIIHFLFVVYPMYIFYISQQQKKL